MDGRGFIAFQCGHDHAFNIIQFLNGIEEVSQMWSIPVADICVNIQGNVMDQRFLVLVVAVQRFLAHAHVGCDIVHGNALKTQVEKKVG